MAPLKDWEPVLGLPDTLEKLLKETEINNSFRESDVTDTLKDTMESSYSYLYRMQRDSIHYFRFHFQTREYLLNTTYNDIQKGLKENGDRLKELESSENPDSEEIAKLKKTLAEFGEVRFGDLYIDNKRRVCTNIDHDIVSVDSKDVFRTSPYYKMDLPLATISGKTNLFKELPIVIMDGEVRMDVSIHPIEQGTRIIFNNMTAKDLYNKRESQIFHDFCVLFIPNTAIEFATMKKSDVLSGVVPFNPKLHELKKGLYFINVKGEKHATHLLPAKVNGKNLEFRLDNKVTNIINEYADGNLSVYILFFQDLHKYEFAYSGDGTIPTKIRTYSSLEKYEDVPESMFFIPQENGSMLPMPVPEENMLIMKAVYENNLVDRYEPMYNCGVKMYYPNMYQIDDPKHTADSKYEVYYFYKEIDNVKYTPLFDFYWEYLRSRYNNLYSLEEVINKIYFREDGYEVDLFIKNKIKNNSPEYRKKMNLEEGLLDVFYMLFEKMLSYKDYKYNYGTPDFISEYKGEDIPLQYKIARMMEFIKADWTVLPEYVRRERRKESLFHFFTNTINLSGRFRRSTRLEDKENSNFMFADGCVLTTPENEHAYLVTSNKKYDINHEVYIDDVKLILPSVKVGDYVEFTNLTNRYVFAFRNPGKDFLAMKVFIDGILCSNVITVNSLGMDYIYLPVNMVNENSYIMMELEWTVDDPQVETVVFNNNSEWHQIHLVETDHVEYTMNDIVLKVDGNTVDESEYTIKLVRNKIDYSMHDDRHGTVNKYGIVTDVNIQFTSNNYEFPVTVDVQINKESFVAGAVANKNGYPRLDLSFLKLNPDVSYARMYYNGRITPSNTFVVIDSNGRTYVQSKIFCEKGDQYLFEFSPYAKEIVCTMDEFDPDGIFDFSKYIDKPMSPEYYEVYVNGRRLGLPNLFAFGPHHAIFRGLKSKYLLTIYEKERDFEYFGYSKIFKDDETYFYLVNDLVNENFMTKEEAGIIIDSYIDKVKHENAIILPNEDVESPITFDIEDGLFEEMKLFFFEELIPLGLGNPDEVQFNKAYFSEVFPSFTKEFIIDGVDDEPDVIFLNPDVTARIYDRHTNDYEIIDTADSDVEKAFVMVTGESK